MAREDRNMKCSPVSAVITAVAACVAYAVLRGGQQPTVEGDYVLGSGKMFDSIAPRYDVINKVCTVLCVALYFDV